MSDVDDLSNLEIYDVNTIANDDPTIIDLLDAPTGSVLARRVANSLLLPTGRH